MKLDQKNSSMSPSRTTTGFASSSLKEACKAVSSRKRENDYLEYLDKMNETLNKNI